MQPRYADANRDGLRTILDEGDQLRVGSAVVTLGLPPPAPWTVDHFGTPLPVVGLGSLRGDRQWAPADRVALDRLAARLADDGEASAGLDPVG